jgi:hypothetical protein
VAASSSVSESVGGCREFEWRPQISMLGRTTSTWMDVLSLCESCREAEHHDGGREIEVELIGRRWHF